MITTKFPTLDLPYSLHDMQICCFEAREKDLIMHINGMVKLSSPCKQVEGQIIFHQIDWDFCCAYILDFCGNEGTFTGEKMSLQTFMERHPSFHLSLIDETYGYHQARYYGWLSEGEKLKECSLEISYTEAEYREFSPLDKPISSM